MGLTNMRRRDLLALLAAPAFSSQDGIAKAVSILDGAVATGKLRAASLSVNHKGKVFEKAFGAARGPNEVFLLASITKPMTAAAVMKLVDARELSLSDPAQKFIPEFNGAGREKITVKMLLTHTSGLPDMLPENEALRKRHAPLKDFVAGACRTPLLFEPGTQVKYQSMGILLSAEIAERITKKPFREFLRTTVYQPLGMKHSSLGMGGRNIEDTAQSQVTGDIDWNWNSPYWRDLGAPWGGAHSTAREVGAFLEYFLNPDARILKMETARSMLVNQNQGLNLPWGIGFSLKPKNFGHGGSTGTTCFAEPATGLVCVLLTTLPADENPYLKPASEAVAEVSA
jgi:beta-lactamase class C